MAGIPASFPVVVAIFFFSFTLSQARIPANIPVDEVNRGELPSSLPESADANPIIRLPSYSEYSRSHSVEPLKELSKESETSNTVQSLPFKVVTFRPVDHPFRLRSRFPFRCRHHHHHHRFFMPTRQHQELPYGDDMILVNGENANADPDQGMFQGRVPRVWPRLVRIRHHHHHGGQKLDGDAFPQLMFKPSIALDEDKFELHKQQPQHHHHHYRIHEDGEKEERKEKRGGGFMKRIRKILDRF